MNNPKFVAIGKGMYRITVRSRAKRERLERIPEVQVDGIRVVFPEWLLGNIRRILIPSQRKTTPKGEQIDMFGTEEE